ncbi:MAG: thermonuclease family protein [Cyanobacteria bacterium P01_H01_bin.74]
MNAILKKLAQGMVVVGFVLIGVGQFIKTRPTEPSSPSGDAPSSNTIVCKVLDVYDGDTVACDINRNHQIEKDLETVRLLGIDTPEMHYSRKNKQYGQYNAVDEPFAKAASLYTEKTALQKYVALTFDFTRRDQYNRLLAYVFTCKKNTPDCTYPNGVKPISMNQALLQKGLAKAFFLGKNRRYEDQFYSAQEEARTSRVGLWQ